MLKAETPDLMILDIQMPEMDGIEMIARMEEFVPFLIQSSLPDDDPRVITLMECGSIGRVSTKSLLGDVERALGTTYGSFRVTHLVLVLLGSGLG